MRLLLTIILSWRLRELVGKQSFGSVYSDMTVCSVKYFRRESVVREFKGVQELIIFVNCVSEKGCGSYVTTNDSCRGQERGTCNCKEKIYL